MFAVYNEAGKSPPTRDKLQPENKAQVRSGRGNRETDATGKFLLTLNIFIVFNLCYCKALKFTLFILLLIFSFILLLLLSWIARLLLC